MILDKIENYQQYIHLNSKLEKAFQFLTTQKLEELPIGRYEIDKDDVFALVQAYTTKNDSENQWETHKKYMDIQYIVKGQEAIGWMPGSELTMHENNLEEKDIAFYNEVPKWNKINLRDGFFALFLPNDGHKPCCIVDRQVEVKKVVIKVKI